jgi:hypothetical protein
MNFYKKYDKSVFKKLPSVNYDEMFGYNGEFDTDDSIGSTIRNNVTTSLHNAVEYIRFHGVATDDDDDENDDDSDGEIMDNDTNSDDDL